MPRTDRQSWLCWWYLFSVSLWSYLLQLCRMNLQDSSWKFQEFHLIFWCYYLKDSSKFFLVLSAILCELPSIYFLQCRILKYQSNPSPALRSIIAFDTSIPWVSLMSLGNLPRRHTHHRCIDFIRIYFSRCC